MVKKILIAFIGLHILALVGLTVFGLATGKFDRQKLKQYVATWKGEKLVPYVEEVVIEEVAESPTDASARIAKSQFEEELKGRELEKAYQNYKNLKITVELARDKLEEDIEQLTIDRKEFDDERKKHDDTVASEGFQKALKYYSSINAKSSKEDFMEMPEDEVVRYLGEMKADVATEILDNFKAPDEQNKRIVLLQQLNDYKAIKLQSDK